MFNVGLILYLSGIYFTYLHMQIRPRFIKTCKFLPEATLQCLQIHHDIAINKQRTGIYICVKVSKVQVAGSIDHT